MPIIALIILVPFLWSIGALFMGSLFYLGWNWGILSMFPSHGLGEITFFAAFFTGLLLTAVLGVVRIKVRK